MSNDTTSTSTFGERIKVARTNKGLTLAQLSTFIGVSPQQVGNIENRGDGISPESLFELSDLLGVNARWLATGKDGLTKDRISERTLDIARVIAAMPTERREALGIVLGLSIK
ncbi:MAG: helix-turn-helix transcriptional regulator [Rhodoferax sp.]|jgi:transcriptional regulator with XRE-family HTH domain|nr:helix-turn-helix transcriptional regulator [Rhodoferax sp.]